MATTTTNYGFDIPQSTDLVKDGATAIATLGQDIDTAMNTALGTKKAGMVLLNTTSFSAVSSQSINSVFTSTYDNYLVYVTITAVATATDTDVLFRLRASGSDTTSNYSRHYKTWNPTDGSAVGTGVSNQGEVYWFTGIGSSNPNSFGEMRLFNPNRASVTSVAVNGYGVNNSTSQRTSFGNFQQTGATQFDGFTFYLAGAGTITGKVSVYGYNL
jgi:hypothetical protein